MGFNLQESKVVMVNAGKATSAMSSIPSIKWENSQASRRKTGKELMSCFTYIWLKAFWILRK